MSQGQPAAFLDRDGTLITDVNYLRTASEIRILPGAVQAVRKLNEAGIPVVVVTNQAGVARGFLTERDLVAIHEELLKRFRAQGAPIDAIYYCPHHAEEGNPPYRVACVCRKPLPGMLHRASRELGIDLARSVMIGDTAGDVEAGRAAGCSALYYIGPADRPVAPPARRAQDLLKAAIHWLSSTGR